MSKGIIHTGHQDGISVLADFDNGRYVVDTPNDYDVNFVFKGKTKEGEPYADELPSPDKKRTLFAIPLDALATEEAITHFNFKVRDARTSNARKERERDAILQFKDDLATAMAIDVGPNPTVILKFGVPYEKVRDKEGQVVQENGKDKLQATYIAGEVLGYIKDKDGKPGKEQGSFYVLMGDIAGHENTRYLRAIPTTNLLHSGEFAKRDEVIAQKFPIGSQKYMSFDEKWKVREIKDYKPSQHISRSTQELAKSEERLKQISQPPVTQSKPKLSQSKSRKKQPEKELAMSR